MNDQKHSFENSVSWFSTNNFKIDDAMHFYNKKPHEMLCEKLRVRAINKQLIAVFLKKI